MSHFCTMFVMISNRSCEVGEAGSTHEGNNKCIGNFFLEISWEGVPCKSGGQCYCMRTLGDQFRSTQSLKGV
jgi:hypothetical protein